MSALRQQLDRYASGTVFRTKDLLQLGLAASRTALDIALKRLVDQKIITRVGRGLFCIPERHPLLGILPSKPEHLAQALALQNGGQLLGVRPDAANRLGLSTQVIARPVFYTTGRSVRRMLDNRTIELRHRSLRFMEADPLVLEVIEALRIVGRKTAEDDTVVAHLSRRLSSSQKTLLLQQAHFGTGWMQPIIRRIVSSTLNHSQG